MQFFLPIDTQKISNSIDYSSDILLVGSCFAENMADKLSYFQFRNTLNPWGILFHPLAIEKMFYSVVNQVPFLENDVFCHQEVWSCFDVHSSLNTLTKEELLHAIQQKNQHLYQRLPKFSHVVITLGTAWIYQRKSTGKYVANCHKIPQKEFSKKLLTVEQIVQSLHNIVDLVSKVNPDCQFIFTISPVRHIKDGVVENQRSKAHLISALHEFIQHADSDKRYYFPSYEIMMDELRDYRFYAEDMLHPNETAVAYIWEKFVETCVDKTTSEDMKKVEEIRKSLNHRPFNSNTSAHQKFLDNLNQKINTLQQKFPFMDFDKK